MLAILFPSINPIAIHLGSQSIHWYGISYIIGIFLSSYVLEKIRTKLQLINPSTKDLDNMLSYIMIGIIIGGRLGYIFFYHPFIIINNFWEIFQIWHGGMSFHGGLIGVILSLWIFCLQYNKEFLLITDLVSCVAPIGLFFGRIGNFINAELYGKKTNASWGIIFPNSDYCARHPSQLYEAIFEGVMLFIIMVYTLNCLQKIDKPNNEYTQKKNINGILSGVFLIFYAIFRIIIEVVREPDSHIGYFFYILSLGQILCFPMIIVGAYLIYKTL